MWCLPPRRCQPISPEADKICAILCGEMRHCFAVSGGVFPVATGELEWRGQRPVAFLSVSPSLSLPGARVPPRDR
eukprot:2662912-Lingulodinium_polyedra.AAC.1